MAKLSDIYKTPTISDKQHVLNFGKYKGKTIEFVMEHDPQYLLYCQSKIDWFDLSHLILDEIDDAERERLGERVEFITIDGYDDTSDLPGNPDDYGHG